jgi:type 1 glutamine amidotransferase
MLLGLLTQATVSVNWAAEPLKALLITGGCCHDYEAQKKILTEGISARANVTWTVLHEGDKAGKLHEFSAYQKEDWAKGFDVIVHNECSGGVTNLEMIHRLAQAHVEGTPGVVLHCSIHSYREAKTDDWRKVLGVSSYRHQAFRPFAVVTVKPEHPVMRGFPERWQGDPDELYEIKKVWPECITLAESLTPTNETDRHTSIWVNTCGKGRIFGTTLGHSPVRMSHPAYLDLVTRGLLWSCDKLNEDGKPAPGYGKAGASPRIGSPK